MNTVSSTGSNDSNSDRDLFLTARDAPSSSPSHSSLSQTSASASPMPPPIAKTVAIATTITFTDQSSPFFKFTRRSGKIERKIVSKSSASERDQKASQVQSIAHGALNLGESDQKNAHTTVRDTGLSPEALQKACEIFKAHLAGAKAAETLHFTSEGNEFLIGNKQLHFIKPSIIALGGSGMLKSIVNISELSFHLIKLTITPTPKSIEEVKKEAEMLCYLHRKGQYCPHLHDPPIAVTRVTSSPTSPEASKKEGEHKANSLLLGIIVPEYSIDTVGGLMDLERWLFTNPSPKDKFEVCRQICEASDELLRAGVHHGDIKPENFVIYRNEKGELKVKLIDFGSAIKVASAGENLPTNALQSHTPTFITFSELKARRAILTPPMSNEVSNKQLDEKTAKEFNDYAFRRDYFAFGITLYMILTGFSPPFQYKNPEEISYPNALNVDALTTRMERFGIPKDIQDILREMLSIDPSNRPDYRNAPSSLARVRKVFSNTPTTFEKHLPESDSPLLRDDSPPTSEEE